MARYSAVTPLKISAQKGIEHRTAKPIHSRSNYQVERMNRTIKYANHQTLLLSTR